VIDIDLLILLSVALKMAAYLNDLYQALRGVNSTFLTEQHVPGADLTGKWIIITGSNNGVGFEAAKALAALGPNMILACREPPAWELHPTEAVKQCQALSEAQGHSSTIEWWEIDMADLDSVEAFCERWIKRDRALDILCNNAGLASKSPAVMTKDGFQLVHQVGSHFESSWLQFVSISDF
jgi:NAD(P)-dependent dehydrogenase (short-subunit alcohol dehydrogenase family)